MIRFNKALLEKLRQYGIETHNMPIVEDCFSHTPHKDFAKSSRRSSRWFGIDDITPSPGFPFQRETSMKNLLNKEIASSNNHLSETDKNNSNKKVKTSNSSCSGSSSECDSSAENKEMHKEEVTKRIRDVYNIRDPYTDQV